MFREVSGTIGHMASAPGRYRRVGLSILLPARLMTISELCNKRKCYTSEINLYSQLTVWMLVGKSYRSKFELIPK